jgi:ribonuclease Z
MGSNLIIHQVAAAKEALLKNPTIKVILDHHTSPEEAGTLFSKVKPQLAVFYHFVLLAGPGIPAVTEKEVFEMARKTYSGPLVIGEDLMTFQIEKDQVMQK